MPVSYLQPIPAGQAPIGTPSASAVVFWSHSRTVEEGGELFVDTQRLKLSVFQSSYNVLCDSRVSFFLFKQAMVV